MVLSKSLGPAVSLPGQRFACIRSWIRESALVPSTSSSPTVRPDSGPCVFQRRTVLRHFYPRSLAEAQSEALPHVSSTPSLGGAMRRSVFEACPPLAQEWGLDDRIGPSDDSVANFQPQSATRSMQTWTPAMPGVFTLRPGGQLFWPDSHGGRERYRIPTAAAASPKKIR